MCLHVGVHNRLIERGHLAEVVALDRAHLAHCYGPSSAIALLGP
jgi:hypothetical protein